MEQQVRFFRERGFTPGGKLLQPHEVDELRGRLDAALAGASDTGGRYEYADALGGKPAAEGGVTQIVNIWKQDTCFRRHHSRPGIVETARALTGSPTIRLFHDQILSKPPRNGRPVNWHQDYGYWQMVTPAEMVTCWVALDDATVANGCMWVVPGSHRWGLLEAGTDLAEDDPEALLKRAKLPPGAAIEKVPVELPAGHCMWHHCLTLHGSYGNQTDGPRRAVITHVMPGDSRYDSRHAHLLSQYADAEGLKDGDVLAGASFPEL